jgi:hypothetical protein
MCTNVRTYYLSKYSNMQKELLIYVLILYSLAVWKFDKCKVVLVVPQCTNMTCGDAGEFGQH